MKIDHPRRKDIPGLRVLWKEAFGDEDAFLDTFFAEAFSEERSLCIHVDDVVAAALYWFDCHLDGRKLAYLYAVATGNAFRGQGLCSRLITQTHALLSRQGYAGVVLVPGSEDLFRMYEKMGYRVCSGIGEVFCLPGETPAEIRKISPREYAALRRRLLPPGGVLQEGENLRFLQTQRTLYAGPDFLLAATMDRGKVDGAEYLGDPDGLAGIVKALGADCGSFRLPGNLRDFAMFRPLTQNPPIPGYFGLAFD